jgi:hypothetical protein
MAEIASFVGGCLFTLLLAGGCLWLSYRTLQYREETGLRRERRLREHSEKALPVPSGGVIRPKTRDQIENERNEELQAFNDLLS